MPTVMPYPAKNVVDNSKNASKIARTGTSRKKGVRHKRAFGLKNIILRRRKKMLQNVLFRKMEPKIELAKQVTLLRDFQDFGYDFVLANCLPHETEFVRGLEKLRTTDDANEKIRQIQELVCL